MNTKAVPSTTEAESIQASDGSLGSAVQTQQELCGGAGEEGLSGKIQGTRPLGPC